MSKLNTDDVTYILDRKKEQAAKLIQRNFKKHQELKKEKLRRELRENGGLIDEEPTEEERIQIEQRKRELKRLTEKISEKYDIWEHY